MDSQITDGVETGEPVTPIQTPESPHLSEDSFGESDKSGMLKRFRFVSDIYDDTYEIEHEEELLFLGVEEPATYNQAII